ncbi:MAG: DUF2730 domain-containing protein [Psychrobacter sp.]|uniref:DUF2730 family protein n=1 Tax=Psychrobacter sp. TaxID=56811 RepID=UPI0026499FB7|nr:DUF2730 family protein [Psychrobacter sp.]MDN5619246.1 DUF2730 domain-containing protein [Psychrobacter sp.]
MQPIIDYITGNWAIFLTACGTIGSVIYLVLDTRYARKATITEGLDDLHNKFNAVEDRVDKVEQELQHLPSARDVAALQGAIRDMKGETSALHTSIKGLSRLVDLLVKKEINTGDK